MQFTIVWNKNFATESNFNVGLFDSYWTLLTAVLSAFTPTTSSIMTWSEYGISVIPKYLAIFPTFVWTFEDYLKVIKAFRNIIHAFLRLRLGLRLTKQEIQDISGCSNFDNKWLKQCQYDIAILRKVLNVIGQKNKLLHHNQSFSCYWKSQIIGY